MLKYDYSAPRARLSIGKVDPMHPDLAVDPLGILRPATKLTHTLPLVTHLYIFCYFLVFLYIPDSSIVEFESDDHGSVFYRLVHTHLLQELELILVMSNKRGEWILLQMNLCLQIVHGTSLVHSIIYFTQVCLQI